MHLNSSNEVDETGAYYTEQNKSEKQKKKHQYSILTHEVAKVLEFQL